MTLLGFALIAFGAMVAWLLRPHLEWVPPPTAAPPPKPPPVPPVRVSFRSGSGRRVLATVSIPGPSRRPRMNWQTSEGMSVFQVSHQEPDGTWVYRRTGVEPNA